MGIMGKTEVKTCVHLIGTVAEYVSNDGMSPPVLYIHAKKSGGFVMSLTNQVIRISCPACFELIRASAPKLKVAN